VRGSHKPLVARPGYRARIVALYEADPKLTIDQVYARTGASRSVVEKVRRDLVELGVLKGPRKQEGMP